MLFVYCDICSYLSFLPLIMCIYELMNLASFIPTQKPSFLSKYHRMNQEHHNIQVMKKEAIKSMFFFRFIICSL